MCVATQGGIGLPPWRRLLVFSPRAHARCVRRSSLLAAVTTPLERRIDLSEGSLPARSSAAVSLGVSMMLPSEDALDRACPSTAEARAPKAHPPTGAGFL